MSKSTPGPWVIDWNVSRLDIFGSDETTLVASLRRSTLSQAIDEAARANARLISAAPEMYEALRDVSEYLDAIPESAAGGDDEAASLARKCRAAIAKVEGK
jgi:hypothetical protein